MPSIHKVRRKPESHSKKFAKFTDDGEEIEKSGLLNQIDRYLATEPGSDRARMELDKWKAVKR